MKFNKRFKYLMLGLSVLCIILVFLYIRNRDGYNEIYKKADGEIIIIFNKEIDEKDLSKYILSFHTPIDVVKHIENYALIYVKEERRYYEILKMLQKNQQVQVAQANSRINILSISDDTYSDTQWALENQGYYTFITQDKTIQKETNKNIDMDVVDAWNTMDSETNNREVVVAIIDTGIDYLHPDLSPNIWINRKEISEDGIDNDRNGYIDDIYGWDFNNNDNTICHYNENMKASYSDNDDHGTHIAGIIGAVANNNIGIAGAASNINLKIMSLKIYGGQDGEGNISDAVEAIKYAAIMGADICNLSWGTTENNEALNRVIKESDMLFIAAAGNMGSDKYPIYPAFIESDNMISVTSIDSFGKLGSRSNYGKSVDIAAPGENIYSTIVGGYTYMSGTSMATPYVSSIAAMLYSYNYNAYPSNVKNIIVKNIKKISTLEGYIENPGIPNANNAVMMSDSILEDLISPNIKLKTINNKNKLKIYIQTDDFNESGIRVIKWLNGIKCAKDFNHGFYGKLVTGNKINASIGKIYTFYASDYVGNETVITYKVK